MKREIDCDTNDVPKKKVKLSFSPKTCKLEGDLNLKQCSVVLKKCEEEFFNEIENKDEFKGKPTENNKKLNTVPCPVCQKDIESHNVKRHARLHKLKTVPCPVCQKDIPSQNVRSHARIHELKTVPCPVCQKDIKSYNVKRHARLHELKTVLCPVCQKDIPSQNVRSHARLHELKTVPCPICHKNILSDNVGRHARLHELKGPILGLIINKPINNEKKFICEICNKDCMYRNTLVKHKRTHNTNKLKPKKTYICEICGRDLKRKCNLLKHQKSHKNKVFSCEECPEAFKFLSQLCRHVSEVHRNIPDEKIECPICNLPFLHITCHIRTHKINPTTCEICNAILPNYYAYTNHIRCHRKLAKQGRDRPIVPYSLTYTQKHFKCTICSRRMSTDKELQSHMMSHLHIFQSHIDNRMKRIFYTCHMCQFEAESQIGLYFHLNSQHNALTNSQCRCLICNQSVKLKYLSSHMRCHAASKYTCEICSVDFVEIKEYRNHCMEFHGTKSQKKRKLEKIMDKHSVQKKNFKKVSCFECRNKIRVSHMRSHMAAHLKYKCAMCEKKFSSLENLKPHEFKHDKISSRCPVCPQTFLSHIRLLAHLKKIHKIPFTISKACPRCHLRIDKKRS